MNPFCPVCWQRVFTTVSGHVARHHDSIGKPNCPGSGLPYELLERAIAC